MIDRFSIGIGRATAWLTLAMVIVSFVIVVIRYVFDSGFIWLQESLIWMHASVFMLGAAYTMQRDEHVRVDIFYRDMSRRKQAIVDLAGVMSSSFHCVVFSRLRRWIMLAHPGVLRGVPQCGGAAVPAASVTQVDAARHAASGHTAGTVAGMTSVRELKGR